MVLPVLGAFALHHFDEITHRTVRLARRLTFGGVVSSGGVRAGSSAASPDRSGRAVTEEDGI
jgi:hypothetical protein